MSYSKRREEERTLEIDGEEFTFVIREIPFREGVEFSCVIDGEELRVSDRGLGEHEALRLLESEIRRYCEEAGRPIAPPASADS